jgi:hypothetical protein
MGLPSASLKPLPMALPAIEAAVCSAPGSDTSDWTFPRKIVKSVNEEASFNSDSPSIITRRLCGPPPVHRVAPPMGAVAGMGRERAREGAPVEGPAEREGVEEVGGGRGGGRGKAWRRSGKAWRKGRIGREGRIGRGLAERGR